MPASHSTETARSPRNRTVLTALWVMGAVAVIELLFAAFALAPRLFTSMRQATLPGAGASSGYATALAEGTAPSPVIPTPVAKPLDSSPVKEMLNAPAAERPFTPPSPESSMTGAPVLQVLKAKLEGADDGAKKLQITIKSNQKEAIDASQVKVQVYFYDDDNGEIVPSKSQVSSSWLSPPVDWKNGEPELLEVRYLPESADPGIKYAGYMIAVYYKGELQDYRADPPRLKKLFEPKFFIGSDE